MNNAVRSLLLWIGGIVDLMPIQTIFPSSLVPLLEGLRGSRDPASCHKDNIGVS